MKFFCKFDHFPRRHRREKKWASFIETHCIYGRYRQSCILAAFKWTDNPILFANGTAVIYSEHQRKICFTIVLISLSSSSSLLLLLRRWRSEITKPQSPTLPVFCYCRALRRFLPVQFPIVSLASSAPCAIQMTFIKVYAEVLFAFYSH